MNLDFGHLMIAFGMNVAAISALAYGLYFRRHQRRDLTLGFVGVNIGLFAVSAFTTTTTITIGFGIGLFALLSVIRLRSSTATQEEIGYYFVALVIGIVNGLAVDGAWGTALVLDAMLLGVMFVADHPRMLRHAQRQKLRLKGIHPSREQLRADIEDRLGFEVTRLRVMELDFVRNRTRVDVRFRTDRPVSRRAGADGFPGSEQRDGEAPAVEDEQ
jgi:hypothetical protein